LGTRGGTGAGKFALVPKLQLGNDVREALLRLPALAPTISWQLQPPYRCEHSEVVQVREAELPGCAFRSWSLGTRGGTGAGKFALVPKLQLGNAVREALLRHPASAPTISWQLQPPLPMRTF